MIIDILTLFPEMFIEFKNSSIIKRAIEKELVQINIHDFRDFSLDKHHKVDDTIYGGGAGMLISVDPIVRCLKSIAGYEDAFIILTSPSGKTYNQGLAKEYALRKHIIIICGHYEGIDSRIYNYIDQEISIGDYILTGGEIASLAIADSIIRLIPKAITDSSTLEESFNDNLLEYDQFTKPVIFENYEVPKVLQSGNHEEIRKYRHFSSLKNTYLKRPDLLEKAKLQKEDLEFLESIKTEKETKQN